jgi:hypothetical protein
VVNDLAGADGAPDLPRLPRRQRRPYLRDPVLVRYENDAALLDRVLMALRALPVDHPAGSSAAGPTDLSSPRHENP